MSEQIKLEILLLLTLIQYIAKEITKLFSYD